MTFTETMAAVSGPGRAPLPGRSAGVSVRLVLETSARLAGLQLATLQGPARFAGAARPRQRAWWVCRLLIPEVSTTLLGKATGGRDHSTVIAGIVAVERRLSKADLHDPDAPRERDRLDALVDAVCAQVEPLHLASQLTSLELRAASMRADLDQLEGRVARLRAIPGAA